MPKKRTKDQKVKAKQHHYSLPAANSFSTNQGKSVQEKSAPTSNVLDLYAYDPIYFKKDLKHTLIFSLLILALQLALYFWLK